MSWRRQPGYGINKHETLPNALPVEIGLTEFIPRGRNLVVQLQFRRGEFRKVKEFGVTVKDGEYLINWSRVKGFLERECNLRIDESTHWIAELQKEFPNRVATFLAKP